MDTRITVLGDPLAEFEAERRKAEKAVTRAVRRAGDGLKQTMRAQTRAAGLGNKLPKTWRSDTYPKTGESLGAAAQVYTKAPKLMQVFDEGATIKSKSGLFLAIPTANAPKKGIGGKRITPTNFPEERLGRLRFVYRRSGPSLLVVDNVRQSRGKRGGFRRASQSALRTGRGLTTAVMFLLVPQVRMRKRIDFESAARRWDGRVPSLIAIEFRRLDAADGAS